MIISKNKFFLLLVVIFILPFVLYKIFWLANAEKTIGEMRFFGRTIEVQGTSEHAVFKFTTGKDTIFFNGNFDLVYKTGEPVSIRYQKNNPRDARVNSFAGTWLDTVLYILPQLLILSILYFTPEKWQPFIPNGSTIAIGKKSLLKIIPRVHR